MGGFPAAFPVSLDDVANPSMFWTLRDAESCPTHPSLWKVDVVGITDLHVEVGLFGQTCGYLPVPCALPSQTLSIRKFLPRTPGQHQAESVTNSTAYTSVGGRYCPVSQRDTEAQKVKCLSRTLKLSRRAEFRVFNCLRLCCCFRVEFALVSLCSLGYPATRSVD